MVAPPLSWFGLGPLKEAVELWDCCWNLIHESTCVANEVMLSESTLVSIWHPSDGAEGLGQGQLLIKTVKLAFSVTNNVIRLKPPSNVVSPLEQALTQHGMYFSSKQQHFCP